MQQPARPHLEPAPGPGARCADRAARAQVFDDACKPLVDHVLDGYNSCCFAYGQTGSGKTYSIFGEAEDTRRGIVPRAMEQVFVQLAKRTPYTKVSLYVSFVEIYMEKLRYAPAACPAPRAAPPRPLR